MSSLGKRCTCTWPPRGPKENMIYQIDSLLRGPVLMLTCFKQWTGVSMGTLTGLWLPAQNATNCDALCSDTFLSKPVLTFWATVARLLNQIPMWINESWLPMTLSLVHPFSFLERLFICTDHYPQRTPHMSCSFWESVSLPGRVIGSTFCLSLSVMGKLEPKISMKCSQTSSMRGKQLFLWEKPSLSFLSLLWRNTQF